MQPAILDVLDLEAIRHARRVAILPVRCTLSTAFQLRRTRRPDRRPMAGPDTLRTPSPRRSRAHIWSSGHSNQSYFQLQVRGLLSVARTGAVVPPPDAPVTAVAILLPTS